MDTELNSGTPQADHKLSSPLRVAFACVLGLLGTVYITTIVLGILPKEQRLDVTSLALVAVVCAGIALTINPGLMDRLKLLQMASFRIEMLERVNQKQSEQAIQLRDMALMLPFLLPIAERRHLLNLASGYTANYWGNHNMRSELRRLRSFDLIKMKSDKHVWEMKDGSEFDLRDFVELTPMGRRWVSRIIEIEREEPHIVVT